MNTPSGATRVVAGAPTYTHSAVPRGGRAQLAYLAFGSLNRREDTALTTSGMDPGRHLAFVTSDALDLDLSDETQRRFGDYELLELVGEGGMGVVYRARQLSLDREVAVKLLSAGPWASRDFVERFQREAQNAARMQHPNIVPIHEVGTIEGLHFFSMRLIRGTSLAAEVKRVGRLPALQAAQLLRVVAEAVDYAHRLGVLHLDLKPANVLIDENGEPHVADFGLARRLDQMRAADNTEVSGTPSYMAPEQATARAQKITPATDIWGLGAVLYELVTGAPPFLADSAQATLQLVVEGNLRSPREKAPDLPRDLEAIILKCMAREPGERYASARDLADDLGRLLENRPVRARPLNRLQRLARWTRRQPVVALLVLVVIAAVAIGVAGISLQWRRANANAAVARQELWDSREADALRLMESGDGWNAAPLLLANIREMEVQGAADRLAGARKRLGIIVNNNPRVIDAWQVGENAMDMAFSPDGKQLAVSSYWSGVRFFDVESGELSFSVYGKRDSSLRGWNSFEYLRFTKDGRGLLVTGAESKENVPRPTATSMQRIDVGQHQWMAPPDEFAGFADASYSIDGHYAVLTNTTGQAQLWATDPWRPLSPLGEPPPSTDPPSRLIAPDGRLFAQDTQARAIILMDAHTLSVLARVELDEFTNLTAWAFSRDARWLALGDDAGAVAVVDCRTFAVQRPARRPDFPISWLEFSEDGAWLAASSGAGGAYLWSWPGGQLLAPPFGAATAQKGGNVQHTMLDRPRGLVLASNDSDSTVLWQVAPVPSASDRTEAVPVTAQLNAIHTAHVEAIAWDAPNALLAVRNAERVRLERLPAAALKHGRAAPQMPGTLRFDGVHLVEVQGSGVQLVDAAFERPAGARIEFAQPPDFAELAGDGATLVVILGRMLHVLDAVSGAERFAPIALGNSPSHVELSPDGSRLVAAWFHVEQDGDHDQSIQAVMYDLRTGALLGGPYPLPFQARDIMFGADGRRLLASNMFELTVRDGKDLAPVPGPLALLRPNDTPEDPKKTTLVYRPKFDADQDVEMAFLTPGGGVWNSELRTYRKDGSVQTRPLSSVVPEEILPLPGRLGTVVAGEYGGMSIVGADGSGRDLDDLPDGGLHPCFALSPDGRWLARERLNGVALWDLHGLARVATLRVAVPRPDMVWQIAFSGDGNHLLARTLHGRLIVWDLSPDAHTSNSIARSLDLRDLAPVRSGTPRKSSDPETAERAALRADDPGPPGPLRPAPAVESARALPGGGVPPRSVDASADTLDLTPWYTFGLRETLAALDDGGAEFRWLPQGPQRLLGIDYDIRGGIGLHAPLQARFELGRTVGAIDVLVLAQGNGNDHLADARFDFADGSRTRLPIEFVREGLNGFRSKPAKPPHALLAAWGWDARTLNNGGGRDGAFVVRVINPHPEQSVAALTLSTSGNVAVKASILAITLEAAGSSANPPTKSTGAD